MSENGCSDRFQIKAISYDKIDALFQEGVNAGKKLNFRVHIGPGSDGSSDDKIAIDMKFDARDTPVRYKYAWQAYRKTALACVVGHWSEIQFNVPLTEHHDFAATPERCAILIHPEKKYADTDEPTAYEAIVQDMGDRAEVSFYPDGIRPDLEIEDNDHEQEAT